MLVHIRSIVLLRLDVLFLFALDCTANAFRFSTTPQLNSGRRRFLLAILLCCPALAAATDLYTSSGVRSTDAAAVQSTEIWHASGSALGKTFITVNFSGETSGGTCMAAEFSNVAVSNPVDATATVNDGAASTTPLGAAVTTTNNSDLVIGAITGGVTNIQSGSGFISLQVEEGNGAAWLSTSSVGTYQPHWDSDYLSFAASTVAYKNNGGTPTLIQSAVVDMPLYSNSCTITLNPTGAGNLIAVITSIGSIETVVTSITDGPSDVTPRSIDLSWNRSDSGGVVGYNVYRSTSSGGHYSQIGHVVGTSFTDANAIAGVTYYYVVTAIDNHGAESELSVETSATP